MPEGRVAGLRSRWPRRRFAGDASPGEAQTRSLLDSCWTPAALAAKPGENVPLKRDHHFDAPLKAAPLAAFAPLSYAPKA